MNRIIFKFLFPTVSRAVNTRNIFTKEYLGLSFRQKRQKESHAKAGQNSVKIKDNFLKSYEQKGIKGLRRNDILNFMDLSEGEKDMANLSRVVEDFFVNAGDPKQKQNLLTACINTCYLRGDVKYSRTMSEGTFFQTFDKNPMAVLTQFQLEYDYGHYQELVDKYKQLTKVKNAAQMTIVMAALCKIGTPEAYKQATEFQADEFLIPKDVDSSRALELFAWFSIQMGHYDTALETLKKKKQSYNISEKIRANVILFALVKSGHVDICLSIISNELNKHSKFGFIPTYSYELLGEIAKAVKHDEKLTQMYKELPNDLEEKGKMDNATVEELVFRPISVSPHSISSDKSFYNPNSYVDPNRVRKLESKDLFDE
jgi:tetratricopeptide (TPR) repeat protein